MKHLKNIPKFFDELSNEEIALLDSYIENKLLDELFDFINRAMKALEGVSFEKELNPMILIDSFHLNLTLENMKRKGFISLSERIYLLDRNSRSLEISKGPLLKG